MTTLTRLNSDMGDILLTNLNSPTQDCTITMPVISGKSAYDLAVENGYVGSLQDWLASLSGWKPVDSDFANYLEQHLQLSALFNGVNSKIEANKAELDARIEERISEAQAISTKLENEAQERIKEANELAKQLLDETTQRVADASKLRDDLQSEAYERALAMDQLADDILSEQVTRVNELKDLGDFIDLMDSKVNSNHTYLLEHYSTSSTTTSEIANKIDALKTTYIDPALNTKATVTAVEQVQTNISRIDGELVTVGSKLDGVIAESGKNKQDIAAVWTDMQVRVTAESALSTRIDNVVATTYEHDARIVAESKARTDADSAMASDISAITARVGTTEGKITTLEEVTNTTNSSLSQVSKKLDNLVITVDGKASSQALNDVSSRVSNAEGTLTSQGQSITKLTNDLNTTNNAVNTKASADSVSALTNRVTETEGKVTSNSNALTALTNRVITTEGDIAKKADASVLVDYYTKTKADEAIAGEIRNYDANLKIGGSNLYHESLLVAGYLLAATGVPGGDLPDAHDPNYYPCKPNEKFAGTFYDLNGVTLQGGAGYLCFYDADKNFISGSPWIVKDVFKTTYITAPLRTAFYRYATHAKGVKAKLEYGTKATDWSPSDIDIKKSIDGNATAISGLTTRVTNNEGNITSQGTSITNLQNSISAINGSLNTKADSSALSTLDNKVTGIDGKVTTNANSITSLQGSVETINNNLTTKADASALSDYYTKVQANEAISGKVDEFKATYSETILPTDKDMNRANTWSRIVFSKKAPYISENVVPDYSYLVNYKKHSEDYFAEGNTMAVPVGNSISYYRAVFVVNSAKVIDLGNLTGDDAHAVYIDNVKVHSAGGYSTNPCSFSVTAGEHIIDIIVNNGFGAAGFSSTIKLSSQVDSMYAVRLVYKSTELNATAISDTYTKAQADSVITSKIETFKSGYVDTELGKKLNASAINNYFNKAETNQAITTATTELNASLAKKVNNDDIPSIVELSQTGKRHLVSTVGLDTEMYYPVCFNVSDKKSRITMSVSLGQSKASWATHGAGWSAHIEVTQRASGWGSNAPDITIERFAYSHCAQSPVIRVGQIGEVSKAIFYLRGGTEYFFYVDNNVGNPELYTSKHVFYEQYNVYCEPIAYDKSLEPKSFKTEIQNNASALTTLKAEVKEVDGKVVATSSRLDTVSTTVGNHTTSIQQYGESINGIKANWTLKLNASGRISGMTLMNDGSTSEFAIEADNFYVGAIDSAYKPFQVKTVGWTGVDGRSYPSGVYINNAVIGDLDAKVIRAGTITADKLAIGTPNNLVSNFSRTNSGTGWANYTGIQPYTSFDGTNTPCMELHTQHSIQVQSDKFKVDPAKSYEFSIWLYSSGGNSVGSDYIGINAFNSSGNSIVVTAFDVNNPSSNWDDGNPYFWIRGHGENYRGKWVKYTGYVLAAGTDLNSIKGVLGLNVDRCFRLKSNTDSLLFRILNFYNDGTTVNNLYMAHPTVREVDTNSLIETVNNKKATGNLYYPGTTMIDGGKIQTGSITANQIAADAITADKIDSRGLSIKDANGRVILSAGTALNVANISGLGSLATRSSLNSGDINNLGNFATVSRLDSSNISTYISGLGVKSLLVGDAQITNANIGEASIDMLHIRKQAVSISEAINQPYFFDAKTSAFTDAIYLDAAGAKVSVEFSLISCNPEGSGSFYVECYVNGVSRNTWNMTGTFGYYPSMLFPFVINSYVSGTTIIQIKVTSNGAKIGAAGYFLKATALKR